ncbi:hypothetical protein CY35_01G078700 [Sphagnum magellanicum]|nr:hypothetical protein CY35_01G078700 [Sphagnum magellanicum]KAH9574808.1 hypothetical protein CY35_01G078700 [Sphagnum magellanicum]
MSSSEGSGKCSSTGFEDVGRLPETSWRNNKMPWHDPPPNFLAKGLQRWPQNNFPSQEEKRLMCTRAGEKEALLLARCNTGFCFNNLLWIRLCLATFKDPSIFQQMMIKV